MTSNVVKDTAGTGVQQGGRGGRRLVGRVPRELGWALPELFALTGLAIAQPLLDVAGKAPDFFLLHRADRGQILLLVAVIVLLPATALWTVEVLAWLVGGERLGRLVHLAVLTGLFAVLALEVGKKLLPVRGERLALAALVGGALAALAYHRWSVLKLWLRYLAPAPLVFALVFATISPTAKLILPSRSSSGSPVPVLTRPGDPLPPVVMIVLDEFPLQSLLDSGGEVDRRAYPNLAEFAADATWYRNATGIGGWTPYAVPAMLSGRYPDRSKLGAAPVAQVYPDNLFTLFGHHYHLKAYETVTELCPPAQCGQTGTRSGFGVVARETAKLYRNIASPVEVPVDPASLGTDTDAEEGPDGLLRQPQARSGPPGGHVRALDQRRGSAAHAVLPAPPAAPRAMEAPARRPHLRRPGRPTGDEGGPLA